MKVGVTGHQERNGINWSWVERSIRTEFGRLKHVSKALSSLAAGTDQVFAQVAINLHIPVIAVIPLEGYEHFFKNKSLLNYRHLLRQSEPFMLHWRGDSEQSFFEAGKFIVDSSDLLFAVWDGAAAEGLGGTADVVQYAKRKGCPIIHFNPCSETVDRL